MDIQLKRREKSALKCAVCTYVYDTICWSNPIYPLEAEVGHITDVEVVLNERGSRMVALHALDARKNSIFISKSKYHHLLASNSPLQTKLDTFESKLV